MVAVYMPTQSLAEMPETCYSKRNIKLQIDVMIKVQSRRSALFQPSNANENIGAVYGYCFFTHHQVSMRHGLTPQNKPANAIKKEVLDKPQRLAVRQCGDLP